MSDNVISLKRRSFSGVDRTNPRAAEQKLREAERLKLEQINQRRRNKPHPKFLGTDRAIAARAIGRLVKELKQNGTSISDKDGLEKVYRYALLNDNTKILSKKRYFIANINPYLDIAKRIAEIENKDAIDHQLQVLRDTQFWLNWGRTLKKGDTFAGSDDRAVNLAILLRKMAERIIRDAQLKTLFASMRREPGQWDIHAKRFRPATMAALLSTSYQNWNEVWENAPPLPSVPLIRIWHTGFKTPLLISDSAEIADDYTFPIDSPLKVDEGREVEAEIHLYREIRLALGPTANAETIGPLFESRAYVEISNLENDQPKQTGYLIPSCTLLNFEPGTTWAGCLDGRPVWIGPLAPNPIVGWVNDDLRTTIAAMSGQSVDSPELWDFTPIGEARQFAEHYYLSWTAVDSDHVSYWLDRPVAEYEQPVAQLINNYNQKTWYPRNVAGYLVELAILDRVLESSLKAEIEIIERAFQVFTQKRRQELQAQTAELIARFDDDLIGGSHAPNQPEHNDE